MIAIIDYHTGNIRSVANALERAGRTDYVLTADAAVIRSASHVLLPGVGEAAGAMRQLRQRGLDTLIPTLTQPVLGICIGTQLLCRRSDEGDVQCLGVFPTDVRRFPADEGLKVPHMGWNTVGSLRGPLFEDIADGAYVYYVHSFRPDLCDATCATTAYGTPFSGALQKDNFFGTQFHPEKSGEVGRRLLLNFLKL